MSDPVDGQKAADELTEHLIGRVLVRAGEMIEQGHCRTAMARDDLGHAVSVDSDHARCFCVTGAIARASHDLIPPYRLKLRRTVEHAAVNRLNAARLALNLRTPGERPADFTGISQTENGDNFIALLNWNDHGDTPPAHVIGALAFAALD